MAISDWIVTKSNPDMSVTLEIDAPIYGTGSLRISQEDIANTVGVAFAYLRPIAGPPQSQFLKGKIRTLMKPLEFTDTDSLATYVSFFGVMAMIGEDGNEELTHAYCAGRWGGENPSWHINRLDTGITNASSFTPLSYGSIVNLPGINDIVAIEFEWIYDPLEFDGVRLTLKAAADDNFTNLETIYQIIDTTGDVITDTIGEGLFMAALHDTAEHVVTVLYDRTINFELVSIT